MSTDGPRRLHVLVALVVVGLLGGTAAAFALTEQLKLERSPVYATHVGKLLGPTCTATGCPARIPIRFYLRKSETLTVVIVDSHEHVVRNLLTRTARPKGVQRLSWDGRDDAGQVVAAGVYKPRLHLARDRRTILMPNPIRVDTTVPQVTVAAVRPRVFSPDGDGRRDGPVRIHVRMSERAQALLYVNGHFRLRLARYSTAGVLRWFASGFPEGRYRLTVRAVDLAGNVSPPVSAGSVRIRFVSVRPHVAHVASGARFGFRVRTDARQFRWRLGHAGGVSRPGTLVLRAPRPGRYVLHVTANGHEAQAVVFVGSS
jgi:hypothetical protein